MTKAERETLKAEYITGDYRTLKEFAEKKGLCYQDIRNFAAKEKWTAAKVEHSKQIADDIITGDKEKKTQDGIDSLQERNDKYLEIAQTLKGAIISRLEKADAKDLNALCSALYRLVEIESNLLSVDKSKSEQDKALEELTNAIMTAAFDDVSGDDNNG